MVVAEASLDRDAGVALVGDVASRLMMQLVRG